jgi:hypothetical protein
VPAARRNLSVSEYGSDVLNPVPTSSPKKVTLPGKAPSPARRITKVTSGRGRLLTGPPSPSAVSDRVETSADEDEDDFATFVATVRSAQGFGLPFDYIGAAFLTVPSVPFSGPDGTGRSKARPIFLRTGTGPSYGSPGRDGQPLTAVDG